MAQQKGRPTEGGQSEKDNESGAADVTRMVGDASTAREARRQSIFGDFIIPETAKAQSEAICAALRARDVDIARRLVHAEDNVLDDDIKQQLIVIMNRIACIDERDVLMEYILELERRVSELERRDENDESVRDE